jgi:hypothetical protein
MFLNFKLTDISCPSSPESVSGTVDVDAEFVLFQDLVEVVLVDVDRLAIFERTVVFPAGVVTEREDA